MTEAVLDTAEAPSEHTGEEVIRGLYARGCLPDFICPDYGGYCISNIAPLVLSSFGLPAEPPTALTRLVSRSYRHIVLLIIDAMGYRLMQRCAAETASLARVLGAGACVPVTSTFPSTTTVALTAIYSGLSPAAHGVTGHSRGGGDIFKPPFTRVAVEDIVPPIGHEQIGKPVVVEIAGADALPPTGLL